MLIEVWTILGAIAALGALVWWAKRQGVMIEQSIQEAANATAILETERKSHEAAQAADSRRDPSLHGVDDVVQPDRLPDWLKR